MIDKQKALDALEQERQWLLRNNMPGAEHILVHHAIRVIEDMPERMIAMSDLVSKSYLLGEIDEVDFYTVYNGKLVQGAESRETALYKAMDIYGIIEELPSAQPETARRIVGKSRNGMTLWYQCEMCYEPVDAQDNFCRGCGRRLTDE